MNNPTTTPQNSKYHVGNIDGFEYFKDAPDGALYRAPLYGYIQPNGFRSGARWEMPSHMADEHFAALSAAA